MRNIHHAEDLNCVIRYPERLFFSGGLVDVVAPTIERGQQVWEKMGRFVRKTCGFELPECLQDVMSEMVEYVGLVYCFKRFANL